MPSIAQLVERWTVVVNCQISIGRWFKSGSKDLLFWWSRSMIRPLSQVLLFYLTLKKFQQKKIMAPRGIEPVTFALFFLSLFQCSKYLTIVKINIGS